ncbi:MAG TPA: hypothetical protein VG389_06390 [Myxococcota bacterium]|nr:hypothetical protein [Myxococcota bacterium]
MPRTARAREAHRLHAGWIALGAAVMVALAAGVNAAIWAAAGGLGADVSRRYAGAYLVGMGLAFVTGGAIVGWWSPGNTVKEAAVSGAIAVGAMSAAALVAGRGAGMGAVLMAGAAGFLLALVGGWLGEWLQERKEKAR